MSSQSAQRFYNQLANDYHLLFTDWKDAVRWQGKILDAIIRREVVTEKQTVLDCSCGIGTQAIGLALFGYKVMGTDISPAAIERARKEANSFGVEVSFSIADFLKLDKQVSGSFNIVISCDNSLPHLLTENDLSKSAKNIWNKLEPGGLFLSSIRDYDQILKDKPTYTPPKVFDDEYGKRIFFQIWEWLEGGRIYLTHLFILKEYQGEWSVSEYTAKYRTLLRNELTELLKSVGFSDIHWLMPNKSGYYQPIVIARKKYRD